ncbi:diaminopimelate decarboxylase [Luteibaculum oceani]|uniref:Diaminopimelate decarboxylase n=1 Tax=Luteibaculum oceani TaxID=1294296 RepID=A0A5C6VAA0_9FLAO|nr:diaminopimelate decarboxylase [Luteibaculum oceani]
MDKLKAYDTPFYLYDLDLLNASLSACKTQADRFGYHVHYAMKANTNDMVLREIVKAGFGADCVSGNEVKKAFQSGFDPKAIVFAGVGKSDKEITDALEIGIGRFNVESVQELEVLNELAAKYNAIAEVNIRINPNVKSYTHANITTGLNENKFGVSAEDIQEIIQLTENLKHIKLGGLHFHIGSQITRMEAFKNLCLRVNEINENCKQYGWKPDVLNLGGGLGIDYVNPKDNPHADFQLYFETINGLLEADQDQEIHFELGRSLVGQCGQLITKVLYEKLGKTKDFLIVDAGMTELMRPALYQAQHFIENLSSEAAEQNYDVVGPICESTDCFGKEMPLPKSKRGDLLAIYSAGAYGESMANAYNLRAQNPSAYIINGKVVRP